MPGERIGMKLSEEISNYAIGVALYGQWAQRAAELERERDDAERRVAELERELDACKDARGET
jgi:hypothetical protein